MGRATDYCADHYALGALLYWLLTGVPPFVEAEPLALLHSLLLREPIAPHVLNPQVPESLSVVVQKLLQKDPDRRYQSVHGLDADLAHCLDELATGTATPFVAGRADARMQPGPPSRLFGREAELARLEAAIDSVGGGTRIVLVRGLAGAGKSALVQGLLPRIGARGGLFVQGRFDEYNRLVPFAGLTGALSELAHHWLAEPPAALAEIRAALLEALGEQSDELLELIPAFAAVLGRGLPLRRDRSNPRQRLQLALAALFAVVHRRGQPLVVFIDNLQWADADSLALVEMLAAEQSHAPLPLVGSLRVEEGATASDAMSARLRNGGVDVIDVTVEPLDEGATERLVADVLLGAAAAAEARPPVQPMALNAAASAAATVIATAPLAPLAQTLHRRTDGNPFFVLQYLRRLFDEDQLWRDAFGWRWDEQALQALPGSDSLVASLLQELRSLPSLSRHVAGGCACLGGAISPGVLASMLALPQAQVDEALLPLLRRDMLLATRTQGEPEASAATAPGAALRPSGVRLRFCHDRMQQAAYELLTPAERVDWHLRIARHLRRQKNDAADRFEIARHYLAALESVPAAERDDVAALLAEAARGALAGGTFTTALALTGGARRLLQREPGATGIRADSATACAVNAALRCEVAVAEHRALCAVGRHDDADRAFANLRAEFGASFPLAVADASVHQSPALASRMRLAEAGLLALEQAARLGLDVPADGEWPAAIDREIAALRSELAKPGGAARFEQLPPMQDPALQRVVTVLAAGLGTFGRWRFEVACWASLRILNISTLHGRTQQLPVALTYMCMVLPPLQDDFATGWALAQAGLRLCDEHPTLPAMARARQLAGDTAMPWFVALEDCLAFARRPLRRHCSPA